MKLFQLFCIEKFITKSVMLFDFSIHIMHLACALVLQLPFNDFISIVLIYTILIIHAQFVTKILKYHIEFGAVYNFGMCLGRLFCFYTSTFYVLSNFKSSNMNVMGLIDASMNLTVSEILFGICIDSNDSFMVLKVLMDPLYFINFPSFLKEKN